MSPLQLHFYSALNDYIEEESGVRPCIDRIDFHQAEVASAHEGFSVTLTHARLWQDGEIVWTFAGGFMDLLLRLLAGKDGRFTL